MKKGRKSPVCGQLWEVPSPGMVPGGRSSGVTSPWGLDPRHAVMRFYTLFVPPVPNLRCAASAETTVTEQHDGLEPCVKKKAPQLVLTFIEVNVRYMGGGGNWIDLAQSRNRWRALMNAVMNYEAPQNAGSFLSEDLIITIIVVVVTQSVLPASSKYRSPQSAVFFNFQYPLFSLRSSISSLRLLTRLPLTSILPSIFPSITCFRDSL